MNENYKVAVCDDICADRQQILNMAEDYFKKERIQCSVCPFDCAADLLEQIDRGEAFDILLLDVVMDGMSGMELAFQLRQSGCNSIICFLSDNREMALQGYEVSALRYLAKPVAPNKLEEALSCAVGQLKAKKEILLPTSRGQQRISYSDIQYVEAFDRGTRFFMVNEVLESKLKFSEVENMLPKSCFVQCHRAYIVNMTLTKRIRPYEFCMKSDICVPISRHRYNEVRQYFADYMTA